MSFENDSRWDGAIRDLCLLSVAGYTGILPRLYLVEGRLARRSVEHLRRLTQRVQTAATAQEERVHAATGAG